MKNTMRKLATNTGVMILAIIAVSGISLYFNVDTLFSQASKDSQTHAGALMVGNVQVVVKDESGNIISYRQGSNHIVATGMQLIGQQVFGSGASGNNSNVTGGGYIEWMEIGNGSGTGTCSDPPGPPVLGWNNETLECPLLTCNRVQAEINRFTVTEAPTDKAQINMTAIATFDGGSGCDGISIDEAGFWNNLTSDAAIAWPNPAPVDNRMFARNTFGSVTLSAADQLELTWKFTFTDS